MNNQDQPQKSADKCYESLTSISSEEFTILKNKSLEVQSVDILRKNATKMVNRLLCDNKSGTFEKRPAGEQFFTEFFKPQLFSCPNLRELAQERPFQLYHDRRPFWGYLFAFGFEFE